jgi:hypothetical protein
MKTKVTFNYETSTKGTHRYQEDAEEPVVGTLYIKKTAMATAAEVVTVTLEWQ